MKPPQERIDSLLAWATSHGATTHASIEITHLPETSFSFIAKADIFPPANLLSIPSSLSLSYLNALPQPPSPSFSHPSSAEPFPESFVSTSPPHVVSRFFLVQQYLIGEKSFWYPYIQTLPRPERLSEWLLPPFWADDDLELLDGTGVGVACVEVKKRARKEYKAAIAALADWPPSSQFSRLLYQWAFCIFSSRSFRPDLVLSGLDDLLPDGVKADDFSVLLPVFDIGNHSLTAKVEWDPKPGTCSLVTHDTYQTGCQVYNNYGLKTNGELLVGYGFTVPETETLHNDYVHLWKRDEGAQKTEYLVSLRPIVHSSSVVARSRQPASGSMPDAVISPFTHVEPNMVWDLLCTQTTAEERRDLFLAGEQVDKDNLPLKKFLAGDVGQKGAELLERTVAIVQHKIMMELEGLLESEFEVQELNKQGQLAVAYRAQCMRVLENALASIQVDDSSEGVQP